MLEIVNSISDFEKFFIVLVGVHGAKISTTKAPEQQKEAERYNQKMTRMYGSSAEHVKTMEMGMQCEFNDHYQKYDPSLWPNIPLRFTWMIESVECVQGVTLYTNYHYISRFFD